MRRRAPANVEAGSSLFTFLDGLICTMGALIVVLVVMVHQGKMSVQAALEAVFPTAADESEIRRSDLEWRIGLMRESRDKTLAQLDDARQALAHLEDHARRLRSQLEEQDLAHDEFQRTVAGEEREHEQLEAQVARAKERIAAARSELDEKLHSVGNHTDSYAIIPYHGNNQTRRRPIYIECGSAGVVFQPEGIVLTEEDFAGDLGPSNPLASGLRAAREHMIRTRGSKPGDDGMPYPLLLVRPDGIGAYLAARAAMGSWSTEFGYELIDQDWPIEFPPADPDMTMAIRQAITEGRLKQAYLARNAPLLRSHGERPSFGPPSGGGGLTRADGSPMGGVSSRGGNGSRSSRPAFAGKGYYQADGGTGGRDASRPKRRPGQGGGTDDSLVGPRYSNSQGNDVGDGQGGDGKGGNGISPYAAALQSLSQGTGGSGAGGSAAGGQNGNGAPDQGGGGAPGSGVGAGGQGGGTGSSNGSSARGNGQVARGGDGAGGDVVQSGTPGTNLRGQGAVRGAGGNGQGAGGRGGGTGSSNGASARGIGQVAGGGDGAGGADKSGAPNTNLRGQGAVRGPGGNGQGAGIQGGGPRSSNGGSAPGVTQVAGGGDGSSGMDQSGTPGSSIGTQGGDGGPDGIGPSGNGQSRGPSSSPNRGVPSSGRFAGGNGDGNGNGGGSPAGNGSGGGGQSGKPGAPSSRSAAGTSQLAGGDDGTGGTGGTGGTEPSGTQVTADPKFANQDPKSPAVPLEQPLPSNPGPRARYGYGPSSNGVAESGDGSGNDSQGDSGTSGGGPSSTAGGASGNASSSSQSRSGSQSSRTAKASTRTGGSGSSSASSSSPGSTGGGTSGGASQPGQAGGLPMPNMTFGEQPQSIAQHRGKNWANQGANDERAKEAIVPVKMICDADHLSLVPERGSGQEMRIIKFSARTADSVNELVDAVWDQVDSWGTAGRGNYWRPKLVLVIEPGGEQRFEDLKSLLKESGFDIEGRPRTPQKPKRPSSAKPHWPNPFRARPRAETTD